MKNVTTVYHDSNFWVVLYKNTEKKILRLLDGTLITYRETLSGVYREAVETAYTTQSCTTPPRFNYEQVKGYTFEDDVNLNLCKYFSIIKGHYEYSYYGKVDSNFLFIVTPIDSYSFTTETLWRSKIEDTLFDAPVTFHTKFLLYLNRCSNDDLTRIKFNAKFIPTFKATNQIVLKDTLNFLAGHLKVLDFSSWYIDKPYTIDNFCNFLSTKHLNAPIVTMYLPRISDDLNIINNYFNYHESFKVWDKPSILVAECGTRFALLLSQRSGENPPYKVYKTYSDVVNDENRLMQEVCKDSVHSGLLGQPNKEYIVLYERYK